jgi:thymidine kinase
MLHEARHTRTRGGGWIEVIAGSMFSGKSEELIRRLRRARIARQNVQVFKPAIDDRYSADDVVSHSEQRMPSERVASAREILDRVLPHTQVVGIDEAQFLDPDLVDVCNRLADAGVRVVVAGLDQDYLGRPFEPMPQLLAVAEFITKARAICVRCGQPALRSQRLGASTERVVVGAGETYEPRCRRCYQHPGETEQPLFGGDVSETAPPATAAAPDAQVRIASASRRIL